MAVLLALGLLLTQALDPIPAPYAPPADEVSTGEAPAEDEAPSPEPAPLPAPRAYLYATYPAIARKLDCMIRLESTWFPGASGAGGRYIGLAQFDRSTWAETPQGKAGLSRTDPYASIDAMAWGTQHLGYARWPVTSRRC